LNRLVEAVEQELKGRVVVVSPHLDDAVLSLGALIAHAARAGADVTIVTIFAGHPDSMIPVGPWDHGCGFRYAGEGARTRRLEDRRACAILGARPVWLPFWGVQYERRRDPDRLWAALEPQVNGADVLLAPGLPLNHPDHAWVAQVIRGKAPNNVRLGFYVEQPYAFQSGTIPTANDGRASGSEQPLRWVKLRVEIGERLAKGRACRAYWSQFRGFRYHLPRRFLLPEVFWTDEHLGWPDAMHV
jgi:LmbE family N-acetylglucosaminyl deacetylase